MRTATDRIADSFTSVLSVALFVAVVLFAVHFAMGNLATITSFWHGITSAVPSVHLPSAGGSNGGPSPAELSGALSQFKQNLHAVQAAGQ
jgi:hypothetical protein